MAALPGPGPLRWAEDMCIQEDAQHYVVIDYCSSVAPTQWRYLAGIHAFRNEATGRCLQPQNGSSALGTLWSPQRAPARPRKNGSRSRSEPLSNDEGPRSEERCGPSLVGTTLGTSPWDPRPEATHGDCCAGDEVQNAAARRAPSPRRDPVAAPGVHRSTSRELASPSDARVRLHATTCPSGSNATRSREIRRPRRRFEGRARDAGQPVVSKKCRIYPYESSLPPHLDESPHATVSVRDERLLASGALFLLQNVGPNSRISLAKTARAARNSDLSLSLSLSRFSERRVRDDDRQARQQARVIVRRRRWRITGRWRSGRIGCRGVGFGRTRRFGQRHDSRRRWPWFGRGRREQGRRCALLSSRALQWAARSRRATARTREREAQRRCWRAGKHADRLLLRDAAPGDDSLGHRCGCPSLSPSHLAFKAASEREDTDPRKEAARRIMSSGASFTITSRVRCAAVATTKASTAYVDESFERKSR